MNSQKRPRRSYSKVLVRHALAIVAVVVGAHALVPVLVAQHNTYTASLVAPTPAAQTKRDSMTIALEPLARIEVKLVMKKDQKAEFSWTTDGPVVTYNLHGEGPDAPGGKAHTYMRGESKAEKGEIVALFDGIHGWSWRNTSEKPVKITVTAWGQFSELKKM